MKNFVTNTLKPIAIISTYFGFSVGITSGCFYGNIHVNTKHEGNLCTVDKILKNEFLRTYNL